MCGRFVAASDPDGLVRFFVIDERKGADLPPSYNVAPTEPIRAVVEHDDLRFLVTFRWGLVPHWADDRKGASKMINARSETAADKPAFRDAFRRRRCIVPADGFYEWRTSEDGTKVPYYIHPVQESVFAFAGLWETWRDPTDPEGEPLRTCTILTTTAEDRIADLHPRMPVILPPDTWDTWLDREEADAEVLRGLLHRPASVPITCHRVSTDVNTPRHNHPGLLDPV